MADVTISQLTQGTPAGSGLIPFSTGSSTLAVPASAILQNVGNVGIGTFNSSSSKVVIQQSGTGDQSFLRLKGISGPSIDLGAYNTTGGQFAIITSEFGGTGMYLKARPGDNPDLVVSVNGNIGIGTINPTSKLHVSGNVNIIGNITNPGVAKAWVNFSGLRDTSGAVTIANTDRLIRASYNVSRVAKTANGHYTIYFTTPMSDANYVWHGTAGKTAGRDTFVEPIPDTPNSGNMLSTASFSIQVWSTTSGAYNGVSDEPVVMLTVFGN